MDNVKIGKFIASLRKSKGLTQKELGKKLSVTDKAISKWERGLSFPDITLLNSLAEVLGVKVTEILNGEYGNDDNTDVDVQNSFNKVIQSINQKQQNLKKNIFITLAIILLFISMAFLYKKTVFTQKHQSNHIDKIIEGDNSYKLENYNLEKNGLDEMIKIISLAENMPQKYCIAYFQARLNKQGNITEFTLSLNTFDDNEEFVGLASFQYKNNTITYHKPKDDHLDLVRTYSKNSNINYINEQLKKVPLNKQIELSELKFYFVTYQPDTNIEIGTPIFDGRDSKKITPLSKTDYNNSLGGKSDSNTRVVIRLYDGTSIAVGQQYLFVFDAVSDDVPNNPNYMMETDYYINQGTLKFTRDYGKTWIDTDVTKNELNETLGFYRDISLKVNSWFLSTNKLIPICYFIGEDPILKLSNDNGKTWRNIVLPNIEQFDKIITRRVVGFSSEKFGYAALGTDYTMGSGEMKKIYFTNDGGKTWEEIEAPANCSSETLIDMNMYDKNNGIIMLTNSQDVNMPHIYATTNGGKSWQKIEFSYFNLPDEITYIYDVDSISYVDGYYIIKLGQGETGILKIIFESRDLISPWSFKYTTDRKSVV